MSSALGFKGTVDPLFGVLRRLHGINSSDLPLVLTLLTQDVCGTLWGADGKISF